ncbi:MAG: type II toxin-antitoxin system VapB family antitoxin [Snowella sp.]|nr:type II toxin-antitoxin system VapB family antitoxin [Snowella sp.]
MQITLDLNENLLQEAINLNPDMPIEKAIENALQAYLEQQKRLKIIDLFGTIDYDLDYNYKQQRSVK